jgi:hypothetical protein
MAYQRTLQSQQTLNKSLSLFQSGRPDKAEKLARSILATEPRNAELLQFVAMLCPTRPGPNDTRLGKRPAFSNRSM